MTAPVTPYTPPAAEPHEGSRPRPALGALVLGGITAFVVGIVFAFVATPLALFAFGASALCFFVAFLRTARHQLYLFAAPAGLVTAWGIVGNIGLLVLTLGASAFGALTAFVSTMSFSRGRQLKKRGKPIFAALVDRSEDVAPYVVAASDDARDRIAAAWRKNGLTEHASVAAFAKLSIELLALGAPRRLVDAAHADALDESRHTDLCFELATKIDGRSIAPGAFPASAARPARGPRIFRLCRLAVDSLIDGAINEGVSARVVAELAKDVDDPAVADVLRSIARDEGRHAVHGFEVLAWCVQEGGRPVVAAVESAIANLPDTLGHGLSEEASDGRWEPYGIPSRARETSAFQTVRERTLHRTQRLLSKRSAA